MGDAGEGLIDAEARIQERMEDLERERDRRHAREDRARSRAGAGPRVVAARADRARAAARSDDARAAPGADRAGHRRSRSPHERDECRRPIVRSTAITTAPSTTSTASPGRSAISTGRRNPARSDRLTAPGVSISLQPSARRAAASVASPTISRCSSPDDRAAPLSATSVGDLLAPRARALRVEGPRAVALVAPRQPVERQPASRPRRTSCAGAERPGGASAVYHYAAGSFTRSKCGASFRRREWRAVGGEPCSSSR